MASFLHSSYNKKRRWGRSCPSHKKPISTKHVIRSLFRFFALHNLFLTELFTDQEKETSFTPDGAKSSMPWNASEKVLLKFIKKCKSYRSRLNFDNKYSKRSINFLDATFHKSKEKIKHLITA